jgi:hypothetical protein
MTEIVDEEPIVPRNVDRLWDLRDAVEKAAARTGGWMPPSEIVDEEMARINRSKKAKNTAAKRKAAKAAAKAAEESLTSEPGAVEPKQDRLIKMSRLTDIYKVIVEAMDLYDFVLKRKVTPQQVYRRLEDMTIWEEATAEGKIGLKLILGMARGVDGATRNDDSVREKSLVTLADAVSDVTALRGKLAADRLVLRIKEKMGKATRKKFDKVLKAGLPAPAEESIKEQPAKRDIQAEARAAAAAKKTDGSEPTQKEINAEVAAIAKSIREANAQAKAEEEPTATPEDLGPQDVPEGTNEDQGYGSMSDEELLGLAKGKKYSELDSQLQHALDVRGIKAKRAPVVAKAADEEAVASTARPGEVMNTVAKAAQEVPTSAPKSTMLSGIGKSTASEPVIEPPLPQTPEEVEAHVETIASQPEPDPVEQVAAAEEVFNEIVEEIVKAPTPPTPPKPPADEQPTGPSEPEKPRGESEPETIYSWAWQRIEEAKANIKAMLTGEKFQLQGDQYKRVPVVVNGVVVMETSGKRKGKPKMEKRWVHTQEVQDAIEQAFEYFGQKYDPSREKILFRAFQLYYGYSVDRSNLIFSKDPEKVQISDRQFIEFLVQIRENTEAFNFPFQYRPDLDNALGGTKSWPLPTTLGVAQFFTQVLPKDGNRLALSTDEFIRLSMEQWSRSGGVRDQVMAAETSQREAILDMVDVIAETWNDDQRVKGHIQARPANSRLSGDEMFRMVSDYAKSMNDESDLKIVLNEWVREAELAMIADEKARKKMAPGRRKKKPTGKDIEKTNFFDDFFKNPPHHKTVMAAINTYARTSQVALMPVLAATGVAEHGVGVVNQTAGQTWLSNILRKNAIVIENGIELDATERMVELSSDEKVMRGVSQMMGLMASKGMRALVFAANNQMDFTREVDRTRSEAIREGLMRLSIGDVAFQKQVTKIFMKNLAYQFARSEMLARKNQQKDLAAGRQPKPIIRVTPAELEAMLEHNPDAFFRFVAKTKEGRAALHFAANTSLAGTDPISMGLRKLTMNPYADFALGIFGGFFLKYGIRSMLRRIPMSLTLTYIVKRGGDFAKEQTLGRFGADEMKQSIADTADEGNEYLFGGNEQFMEGLGQALIIDLARVPSQIGVVLLVAAVISRLGLEPPDEDELDHLWYEYKIGGRAIKTAWYWTELLGSTMPLVVAGMLSSQGDTKKAWQVLGHGLMNDLEDGSWVNVVDTLDLVTNTQFHFMEAQDRADGYSGGPLSEAEYGRTRLVTFIGRRLYSSFEPAIGRALWNEAGLDQGGEKLAHSTNVVYTSDPNDDIEGKLPRTTQTSWSDSMIRKMAYPSPTMGFFLNLFGGYFINNDEDQRTGYWKYQMPYITNADPFQTEMMSDLVVLDENGEEVPMDQWTDAETRAIANRVIDWVTSDSPSQLAANGVVLPFEARIAAKLVLDEQWRFLEDEYRDRIDAGEFNYKTNGMDYNESVAYQREAWNEKDAAQKVLKGYLDNLWSDEIPYGPTVYNRWETSFRPLYTWKDGTEKAGQPATKMEWRLNRDDIEASVYASGDHKSSLWPTGWVDDQGANTYNAETALAWQQAPTDRSPGTDMEFVRSFAEGNTIDAQGMFQGEDLWSVVGPGVSQVGSWDNGKLVMGVRAYKPVKMPYKDVPSELKTLGLDYDRDESKATTSTSNSGWGSSWGGWGGGGGGSYSPNIYSHAPYNLNSDKPSGLYTKVPYSARFDYLRPSVKTKGSREAYRREDF